MHTKMSVCLEQLLSRLLASASTALSHMCGSDLPGGPFYSRTEASVLPPRRNFSVPVMIFIRRPRSQSGLWLNSCNFLSVTVVESGSQSGLTKEF